MNYNVSCDDIKITIFPQIKYPPYKNFYALAEWTIDGKIYWCNQEENSAEKAYEAMRRFLKQKGLGRISRKNVISWPGGEL